MIFFFLEKQLIKFSCTYQHLSFCKILEKFLEQILSYGDVPLSGSKWFICPEQFFLVQTIIITFIFLLALSSRKILKNFYTRSRVMRMCYFWAQNGPLATNFFGENYFSSTYQPPSLCKIFKKFFQWSQSYEGARFLGPKEPTSPNENFF